MASPNIEEYLESILRLGSPDKDPLEASGPRELKGARPSDIAELTDVSRPSVSSALTRMEGLGFIERDGTKVILTDLGFKKAHAVLRRHRVSEEFLTRVLGLSEDEVHEEACELEHAISERVLKGLEDLLERYED